MRGRWRRLCDKMGVYLSDPGEEFENLEALYSKPTRAYHNLDHIGRCLEEYDRVKVIPESPASIEMAIWFHDAVYDPRSNRNEEDSVEKAASFCDRAGVLQEVKQRTCRIIMASKHVEPPVDRDEQAFVDIDLSILGQPSEAFWAYEEAICREYRWVPEETFKAKRVEILERFLARPWIYSTGLFRERYERKARENLKASIARLTGKG